MAYCRVTNLSSTGRGITGKVSDEAQALLKKNRFHPESLAIELKHFHAKFALVYYVCDVRNKMCGMATLVRGLYGHLEALYKLLLMCSRTSSEAQLNFSKLRRITSWLRNKMTALCHSYKKSLDVLDINAICKSFVCNEQGRRYFGNYL